MTKLSEKFRIFTEGGRSFGLLTPWFAFLMRHEAPVLIVRELETAVHFYWKPDWNQSPGNIIFQKEWSLVLARWIELPNGGRRIVK